MKNEEYWLEHRRLELTLFQFSASLPRIGLSGGQNSLSLFDLDMLTIHTMAHVSTIHLHRELSQTSQESYSKCLAAARFVTSLICELHDEYYDYLDPISSVRFFFFFFFAFWKHFLILVSSFFGSSDMLDIRCRCLRKGNGMLVTIPDASGRPGFLVSTARGVVECNEENQQNFPHCR